MQYHFISGLPRSGSTVLASILRQNMHFEASIMTPVGRIVTETLQAMGPGNEADGYITNAHRTRILRGVFDGYYEPAANFKSVVFDNNRRWCANVALLTNLYPRSRIICCMRQPAEIVDSFERLFQAHPLNLSVIPGARANTTVYERAAAIMKPDGVVGFALNAFRSAYFGDLREQLILVEYSDLCRYPGLTMANLHKELRLAHFNYDFNKIEPIPGSTEFDRDVSTPGLHDLKPKVVYQPRTPVLPPDLFNALPPAFWRVKEPATPTG